MSTPRFVIAVRESSTVESRILRDFQDLMILKILRSLKALSTLKLESSPGMKSSTRLMMTMKQSKMLNPSETYFLHPKPTSFRIISIANTTVKK